VAEKEDKEIESYRSLMVPPREFEGGFSISSLIGAFLIGVLMVPGSMYMGLLAGLGVGSAARWVTIILFIEVARLAHQSLSKAQIFTLFHIAGAVMTMPFVTDEIRESEVGGPPTSGRKRLGVPRR